MPLSITGPVVDAAAAWQLLGDSDHLNRAAGNPPLRFQIQPDPSGFPELQGEILGPGPVRHRFTEVELSWVQGQYFRQVRALQGPMLKRAVYAVSLEPVGEGVRPTVTVEMVPRYGWMGPLIHSLTERGLQRWSRLLDALPAPGQPSLPPVQRALDGPTEAALQRWGERGASGALVEAVRDLYARARSRELHTLRPFDLARRWGLPPRDLLVSFLEGTLVGAMELYWSVRCPRCQGGVARAQSLSNLADHAGCPSCRIEFEPDLEASVEVLFAAPAALRASEEQLFCTLFPAGRPEVLAMMILQPGVTEQIALDLPAGSCRIGTGGDRPDQVLTVGADGEPAWDWSAGGTVSAGTAGEGRLRQGLCTLSVQNPTDHRVRVDLSLSRALGQGVSAALLATMPEYRDRFGPQILAADVRIGVRAVAILFTDLTGSAALYHEQAWLIT